MTNGIFYIGNHFGECCPSRFEDLPPGTTPFIAPYWVDSDPSVRGNVSYEVHNTSSPLLQQVSDYVSVSQNVSFSGTWMVVAYWWDVPELFLDDTVSTQCVAISRVQYKCTYCPPVSLGEKISFYCMVGCCSKSCCYAWIGATAGQEMNTLLRTLYSTYHVYQMNDSMSTFSVVLWSVFSLMPYSLHMSTPLMQYCVMDTRELLSMGIILQCIHVCKCVWDQLQYIPVFYPQSNTYQAVIITDGILSYAIYIYKCGALEEEAIGGIGYYFDASHYIEHPLSNSALSSTIACGNSTDVDYPWKNLIYWLNRKNTY